MRLAQIFASLLLATTLFLDIAWVAYLGWKIWKIYRNKYENTQNSHPSYISELKLYNYRTQITKYVLMFSVVLLRF